MCYFPHRNGVYSYNIYSRIQSGNHIAFTTIYVFEHIEASQTKRRDSIYVVIKVWWTLPFWGHQFTNFMVQTWKYSRMNSAVEKNWNQQVIRWQLQKFYMFFWNRQVIGWLKTDGYKSFLCFFSKSTSYWVAITKVSYVFPPNRQVIGWQLQKFAMFFEIVRKMGG